MIINYSIFVELSVKAKAEAFEQHNKVIEDWKLISYKRKQLVQSKKSERECA